MMNIFEQLDHLAHANALMYDDLDTIEAVKSRITTAEAERDAASGAANAMQADLDLATARIDALTITAIEAYRDGHFAGEQRATAAIVEYLRMHGMHSTAAMVERGDHLKEPKP